MIFFIYFPSLYFLKVKPNQKLESKTSVNIELFGILFIKVTKKKFLIYNSSN
tara:strand:+ start:304 stop:459 length:156 start_codon:yes stop_codon:yes gene_type:complete